eukprot:6237807-Pyramimonas_sp.AAC.1
MPFVKHRYHRLFRGRGEVGLLGTPSLLPDPPLGLLVGQGKGSRGRLNPDKGLVAEALQLDLHVAVWRDRR